MLIFVNSMQSNNQKITDQQDNKNDHYKKKPFIINKHSKRLTKEEEQKQYKEAANNFFKNIFSTQKLSPQDLYSEWEEKYLEKNNFIDLIPFEFVKELIIDLQNDTTKEQIFNALDIEQSTFELPTQKRNKLIQSITEIEKEVLNKSTKKIKQKKIELNKEQINNDLNTTIIQVIQYVTNNENKLSQQF